MQRMNDLRCVVHVRIRSSYYDPVACLPVYVGVLVKWRV